MLGLAPKRQIVGSNPIGDAIQLYNKKGEINVMIEMILIILGSIIMVGNIAGYIVFMYHMNKVVVLGKKSNTIWLIVGLILLVFFLLGYVIVGVFLNPSLLTAFILLFGAIFVTVMLILTSHLLKTAMQRSMEITQLLVDVVDARDPNLNGHSSHVKEIAMVFYNHLPLNLKRAINIDNLEYAALLHDIGKLGVPEAILNKPSKLTDDEWEIMKKHPAIGTNFLRPLKSFEPIFDWILYHHERADGKGYYSKDPKDVPLAAKLLAVADTYSAITMRRSYKAPKTHEDAINIIQEVAGTQLDSELASIFITIPKEELIACMPEKIM